jgi:hypothetical protein
VFSGQTGGPLLTKYGTEQVGISAEIAIGDLTGVPIAPEYRNRGRVELATHITPTLGPLLSRIPKPVRHIAEDQNPVDFLLQGGSTLSVKTNMREAGKIAPQNIGQPTSLTFWSRLPELIPEGVEISGLNYQQSARLFKQVAQSKTTDLLTAYWRNLFDCDFLIYVSNVLGQDNELSSSPTALLYKKAQSPDWDESLLTFTKSLADWNESSTVKYANHSIGEFQIHNNRNCFKFRFNIKGLMEAGLL